MTNSAVIIVMFTFKAIFFFMDMHRSVMEINRYNLVEQLYNLIEEIFISNASFMVE